MQAFDNTTPHLSTVYDEQVRKTIPYYDAFHEQTMRLVAAFDSQPATWLDTGAGTGALVEQACDRFPATRFLVADPAAAMLTQARTRLAGKERVTIMEPAGSQHLALPEPVDVVTATQAHHYLRTAERAAATRACHALLRPGGLFVTFENIRPSTAEGTELARRMWADFQTAQGRSADEVQRHLARFDVDYFPLTVQQHLELLTDCGFTAVELFWYSVMQAGFWAVR
jgi:tRNA (cmo5U34)-methyltransferase